MRRCSFSCLLLAVLVLSSCWVSTIGGKIRAQSELSVAVDTAHPLHGEVFLSPLPFRAVQTAQPVMPEQVSPLYQPEPGE